MLETAAGLLTLVFGTRECSDFWGDGLRLSWESVGRRHRCVRYLVVYLDNGPKNLGVTRKFPRRMAQFAGWRGLEVRLVDAPPCHSNSYPVERRWCSLQRKWNGVLLTCRDVVRACALRMTWRGRHLKVHRIEDLYDSEDSVTRTEMEQLNARLKRSETLKKYDIVIKPLKPRGR